MSAPPRARERGSEGEQRAAGGRRGSLDTHRRADALWRGEALAELRRLLARGVALTDDERAFAAASDSAAALRARRIRRGAVVAAMLALAAIATVMAALGIAARDSAPSKRTCRPCSPRIALTGSLVAQGIRELNDGRDVQALAHFGDALGRGADSRGLRFMVAIATRGWRDEIRVVRDQAALGITAGSDSAIVVNSLGVVRWWSARGEMLGELDTHVDSLQPLVRQRDGSAVAISDRAVLVIDGQRRVAQFVAGHAG